MNIVLFEDNERYLADTNMSVYYEQKKEVKLSEKTRIKRKIINIIKGNTAHNLIELNRTILEILRVDNTFRDELFHSRQLTTTESIINA